MTDTIIAREPLYKYDSKGKLRVWHMEREGSKHRTVAGLEGGKLTESAWTQCVGKQKRTDEEQAQFEIDADYTYQLAREYFLTPEEAEGGARFFKPMLAEKWKDIGWAGALKLLAKAGFVPKAGETGIYGEPKLDGFCCISQITGLTAREGPPIIAVPHISEALALFYEDFPEAPLHGELYNHDLKDDFESLSSILKKQKDITPEQFALAREMAQFHVYDWAAPHVRDLVFSERKAALKRDLGPYLAATGGVIRIVDAVPLTSDAHLEEHRIEQVELGYEGQMVKLDIGPYEQKRSKQNRKNKVFDDGEFDVVRIEAGVGNYAGYAKRVICWRPGADRSEGPNKDNTFGAGIKGKRDASLELLLYADHKVVTLRYFGLTKYGVPRMGVAIKWHGEKRTL